MMPRAHFLGLVGLSITLLAGPTFAAPPPRATFRPAQKNVLTGGSCLELGETEQPAYTRDTFLQRVANLVAADRRETARRFIRRYPDVALDTLRSAGPSDANQPTLLAIAAVHDEQCGSPVPAESWLAMLQDRATHPDRYRAYDTERRQFHELLHNGNARKAASMSLGRHAPVSVLAIDAYQLLGEAALLNEKPGNAIDALSHALKLSQAGHRYQTAQLLLLLGEAQRRAGKKADGVGTWQQAILLSAQLATAPVPVHDPSLWERASYLRPVQCSWPEPAMRQLVPVDRVSSVTGPAKTGVEEAWLWASIGQWRLTRSEAQAALVALKRAEALNLDRLFQDQMRLGQARALIQLQQRDAAMAILAPLAANVDSLARAPALALLGSLKLMDGSTEQTLAMLKKAVEENPSGEWPGRGEAEADLGLAYLMNGSENNGLRWLHSGQKHFEAAREHELLLLSLENEARYFEQMKMQPQASGVRQRMALLEQN